MPRDHEGKTVVLPLCLETQINLYTSLVTFPLM